VVKRSLGVLFFHANFARFFFSKEPLFLILLPPPPVANLFFFFSPFLLGLITQSLLIYLPFLENTPPLESPFPAPDVCSEVWGPLYHSTFLPSRHSPSGFRRWEINVPNVFPLIVVFLSCALSSLYPPVAILFRCAPGKKRLSSKVSPFSPTLSSPPLTSPRAKNKPPMYWPYGTWRPQTQPSW